MPLTAAQRALAEQKLASIHKNALDRKKLWLFKTWHLSIVVLMLFRPCYLCGLASDARLGVSGLQGLDRVDPLGPYSLANCRPCCLDCNIMKGFMTLEQLACFCLVWVATLPQLICDRHLEGGQPVTLRAVNSAVVAAQYDKATIRKTKAAMAQRAKAKLASMALLQQTTDGHLPRMPPPAPPQATASRGATSDAPAAAAAAKATKRPRSAEAAWGVPGIASKPALPPGADQMPTTPAPSPARVPLGDRTNHAGDSTGPAAKRAAAWPAPTARSRKRSHVQGQSTLGPWLAKKAT